MGVELQPIELGDSVDDGGNFVAERLCDIGECQLGVLHGIVQECRNDRCFVQPDVGHHTRHRHRMRYVRLAGGTSLMAMCFTRRVIGAVDVGDGTFWMATLVDREQWRKFVRGGGLLAPPRQHPGTGCHMQSL